MPDLPTLTADEAQQPPVCPDCGQEIDDTVCWCGTLRADHGGLGENHGFIPLGCNCGRDKPKTPTLTADEAAVLPEWLRPVSDRCDIVELAPRSEQKESTDA